MADSIRLLPDSLGKDPPAHEVRREPKLPPFQADGEIQLPTYVRDRGLLEGKDLARYRNQPDKSLHQPRTAMHHRSENHERAFNLSIHIPS